MPRREPRWLARAELDGIHAVQLEQHGGLPGIRDVGALESALARPQHQWHYDVAKDLAACAAAYGFAIAKNHAFSDGNKRSTLVAMGTFLLRNGVELIASEADAVTTMLAVASSKMKEGELAEWLRDNTRRLRKPQTKGR
jgi:death-on-curing protein